MNFGNFINSFNNGGTVYLEDSVMWYCLQSPDWYLQLNIHQRINYKQSYYVPDNDYPY